jgi:hypothetical protein
MVKTFLREAENCVGRGVIEPIGDLAISKQCVYLFPLPLWMVFLLGLLIENIRLKLSMIDTYRSRFLTFPVSLFIHSIG